jgi:hypothetical protein
VYTCSIYDSNVFYNKTLHLKNKENIISTESTSKLNCLDFDMGALVLQKAFADVEYTSLHDVSFV